MKRISTNSWIFVYTVLGRDTYMSFLDALLGAIILLLRTGSDIPYMFVALSMSALEMLQFFMCPFFTYLFNVESGG